MCVCMYGFLFGGGRGKDGEMLVRWMEFLGFGGVRKLGEDAMRLLSRCGKRS
jgi:hypothetical protein